MGSSNGTLDAAEAVQAAATTDWSSRAREAMGDARMLRRENAHMGQMVLSMLAQFGDDGDPEERIAIATRIRWLSDRDAHVQYAIRLRNAFCFGAGAGKPKAPDPDVQEVIDDYWDDVGNQAEFLGTQAQHRKGRALWCQSNVYPVIFDDGLDGRVKFGQLPHDRVVGVVRDPDKWTRILYYEVREHATRWDAEKRRLVSSGQARIVLYESLEGMAELRAEGGTPPPVNAQIKPGRVLHISINRGDEQAFGMPELRTIIRWAAAFNDIMAGQTEKAKAAQSLLMKVKTKSGGPNTLMDAALRAVARTPAAGDVVTGSPLADQRVPGEMPPPGVRPGSQWWENDGVTAEPFNLDSGAAGASQDLQSAADAMAAGTNYPGHYFHGDAGALAGAQAVELPVLKLTEVDQKIIEDAHCTVIDRVIERAIEVGLLTTRRARTEEEIAAGIEPDADGMVERDLTYEFKMPDPLRRNLPEIMQIIVDMMTTFDPAADRVELQRAALSYVLSELLGWTDAPQLVERAITDVPEQPPPGDAPPGTDPGSIGPDGNRHTSDNPYGVRVKSPPVVEAAEQIARAARDLAAAAGGNR